MKALLLGLVLCLAPIPLSAQQTATLSLMPSAATAISHGYALWSTGQLATPHGCLRGEVSSGKVAIMGAGPIIAGGPSECASREDVIGFITFLRESISQEDVCTIARAARSQYDAFTVVGIVYGLQVKQFHGLDYTSPRVVWCSTPIGQGWNEDREPSSSGTAESPVTRPLRRT